MESQLVFGLKLDRSIVILDGLVVLFLFF